MERCTIFCAGGFDALAEDPADSLVIAADGGLTHLQKLGIEPQVILGDFDSLGYAPRDARVFPAEKDDTDSMLAVRHGLAAGCKSFVLYGALDGPRLDHTVANLQTLAFLTDHGASGCLVGKDTIATVLKNGSMVFPKDAEGIFSVFCMGSDATGVTIEGGQYDLRDGTLTAAFPLGVSNHFVGETVRISVKQGTLLVLYPRKAGIVPCLPTN